MNALFNNHSILNSISNFFDIIFKPLSSTLYLKRAINKKSSPSIVHYATDTDLRSIFITFIKQNYDTLLQDFCNDELSLEGKPYKLFFDALKQEYKLPYLDTLAIILYLKEDIDYQKYLEFIPKDIATLDDILYYIALYNLAHKKNYDNIYTIKLIKELHIPYKFWFSSIENKYSKVLDSLKSRFYIESLNSRTSLQQIAQKQYLVQFISNTLDFSIDPSTYFIVPKDYTRTSPIEKFYEKYVGDLIANHFGKCCGCNTLHMGENKLEFDHFWLPKSQGGIYTMRSHDGYYVNNCIPLCPECNKLKGAKSFYDFFGQDRALELLNKNNLINTEVNCLMKKFKDLDFPNRKL